MLTWNWWGNIRTRGLGPTPENKCQPMRWFGLWRRPMGEVVCDSVLRMKVESREFNSAIALMSSLECDRSFCSILWDIGALQPCLILTQLLQNHFRYISISIQKSLEMQKNINMMFVKIRNNLKDKRTQIGWHKRNPATCPEYSFRIQLKFFSFCTKINYAIDNQSLFQI